MGLLKFYFVFVSIVYSLFVGCESLSLFLEVNTSREIHIIQLFIYGNDAVLQFY